MSAFAISPPMNLVRAMSRVTPAETDFAFAALWDLGNGYWGGVVTYSSVATSVPFTYEPYAADGAVTGRLTLWQRDRTEHLMEAIRRAATRCDAVWIGEADYSQANADPNIQPCGGCGLLTHLHLLDMIGNDPRLLCESCGGAQWCPVSGADLHPDSPAQVATRKAQGGEPPQT